MNEQNNSWTVEHPFPTNEEIQSKNPPDKIMITSLWARDEEEIVFSAKFGEGSHMNVTWHLETDANDQAYTASDDCKTQSGSKPALDPDIAFETAANHWCQFPFRYNNTLFYGCSNFTLSGDVKICATSIDEDYNAEKVGICNEYCHVQGNCK